MWELSFELLTQQKKKKKKCIQTYMAAMKSKVWEILLSAYVFDVIDNEELATVC